MSVQKLKSTILQLERKRNKRRLAVRRLQEEHDQLLLHCKAMDLLVQHQDIVVRMLHRYFQPCCSPPSSIEDDTGFITPLLHDCPQLAGFEAMRLADYNWLLSATAQQVGTRCFHHLQRIAMVMNQRKASSSSNSSSSSGGGGGNVSQQQQADMDEAVSELLLLTKAMYILTPGIVYALKDVNLMTMQLEPPPDSHWERAFCATEASLEQLQLFEAVLQQVVPRMQQLEEDRQELAACINSVKALTLKEQSAHAVAAAQQLVQQQEKEQQQQQQQQQQQTQETKGRVGASRAAGLRKEAVQQVAAVTAAAVAAASAAARVKKEDPEPYAQANGWHYSCAAAQVAVKQEIKQEIRQEIKQELAGSNGYYTSLLQQAMEAAGPAAPPQAAAAVPAAAAAAAAAIGVSNGSDSNSNSNSSSATSMSTSTLRYMRGTCKDMVAHMGSRLLKWRTLSGARSAVTFILRSEQLAAMLLAAFPYLPMMGCMCDYVPAARAAAEQREKPQQPQQQQQKQKQRRRQQR